MLTAVHVSGRLTSPQLNPARNLAAYSLYIYTPHASASSNEKVTLRPQMARQVSASNHSMHATQSFVRELTHLTFVESSEDL